MRNATGARTSLARADAAIDEIDRTIWLAKAMDYAIRAKAVLVGGAAVNLYTGSYRPTDVDMCAYLDETDRSSLRDLGFHHFAGDHFAFTFTDGEEWLVEFSESFVDGDVMDVILDGAEPLTVISLESLIVVRIRQATDGTAVTFEEAVRLLLATEDTANWPAVGRQIASEDRTSPHLNLQSTYDRIAQRVDSGST